MCLECPGRRFEVPAMILISGDQGPPMAPKIRTPALLDIMSPKSQYIFSQLAKEYENKQVCIKN